MKIEVDIKRAEQSFDFATQTTGSYLVVDVYGIEIRVPCDEEQLATAIAACGQQEVYTEEAAPPRKARVAPSTFVAPDELAEDEPRVVHTFEAAPSARTRELRPIVRQVVEDSGGGDDVGISQG